MTDQKELWFWKRKVSVSNYSLAGKVAEKATLAKYMEI